MTVGSLCAGVGGFDLAFEAVGFTILFQVEIDKFCLQVLEKHWPKVQRFRDVRNCHGLIGSSAGSRVKIYRQQESVLGSMALNQDSGKNSSGSLTNYDREVSSSKTSITHGDNGCPCCGAPCGRSGIPLC